MCVHKNVQQWWNWIRNNSQKTKILSDKVRLERFRQKARCELPLLEVSWLSIPPKNTKGIHFRGKNGNKILWSTVKEVSLFSIVFTKWTLFLNWLTSFAGQHCLTLLSISISWRSGAEYSRSNQTSSRVKHIYRVII